MLAQLEYEKLAAKLELLQSRNSQLQLRSPIDGVILQGSENELSGISVETGDVLYEVAPLQPIQVEVEIPAEDVAFVQAGQQVRVWIDGLEHESFLGEISLIRPRSELKDSANVFVAELTIPNSSLRFRPGMAGRARIDSSARPLAWNLFHKPWNYIVSRLSWW